MKISSKGQITVPKRVRKALEIKPGDDLSIELIDATQARLRKAKGLLDLAGSIAVPGDAKDLSWSKIEEKAHQTVAEKAAKEGL